MKIYIEPDRKKWSEYLTRPVKDVFTLDQDVLTIMNDIRNRGADALHEYSLKFDGVASDQLLVSEKELEAAADKVKPELKEAIDQARSNIEKFHNSQVQPVKVVETTPGVKCWQKAVPVQKVGLYVPGGLAPLFSTVLMLGVPAIIAGCEEIVLCTPPNKTGQIDPAILYTAHLIGIHKVVKLGGIQAISAMTFGIGGVPGVDKIFGPGNQYVTAAKQLAARFGVAIDMPAGPSEVAVLADDLSNPAYIAADLLSQAEHGPDSQVILVGSSKKIVDKIVYELNQQLDKLPRKKVAYKAMQNSRAFVFGRTRDMIDITNAYAPEHLIICTTNYEEISANIVNAGSVFLGPYTTESAGDYASGTNHTLPTNGWARAYSGVNLDSFTKKITFQYISDEGLKMIGPAIELMAETEQLTAHKNAVTIRLNDLK